MRKVELSLKEKEKYEIIKKLVETNGNKERAKIKLKLKSIRQINRLIAGYKEHGKEFFVHGNRGRKPKHALTEEFKDEIETLYTSKYFDCTYTQFAYACNQLGTSIECSSIPEFKPRIERRFESFQLRLIPELRLANITTIVDAGHSICFKKKHYRTVNSVGTPIYFGKGSKAIVIESFDKKLYATVEDSIFALEEIPEVQAYSENFDEILPIEPCPQKIAPKKSNF